MLLNGQKFVAFYKYKFFLALSNSDIVERILIVTFASKG